MAKTKWVVLKQASAPAAVTPLTIESTKPVAKREERQTQLRGELERQVIEKRREQLATAGDRLGHLTARPVSEGGSVHQWSEDELQKSASEGDGLSVFWRETDVSSLPSRNNLGVWPQHRRRR